MSNDTKCGPENCPVINWGGLSPDEQRAQRRSRAEKLSAQGFTEAAIAATLGVSQATISGDLKLSTVDKLKPAKTTTNPKGAGRPKGSRKTTGPQQDRRTDLPEAADLVLDAGMSYEKAAELCDASLQVVRASVAREEGRRQAQPHIDPGSLSMSARERAEAYIRQQVRKFALNYQQKVAALNLQAYKLATKLWDEVLLPKHKQRLADAERILKRRQGVMTSKEYRLIWSCLHPDQVSDQEKKHRYSEAFDIFRRVQKLLLDEKQLPTEELQDFRMQFTDAVKQRVKEERRAKRRANGSIMRA